MSSGHYSTQEVKRKYDQIYQQAYEALNEAQRQAVDAIDGPVMVNAGPGTGKTQIMALRVGQILKTQDIHPHNILCLTFTDSATISMRERLVDIIGPVAHKIHIHTYHSFCNQIIQENLDIFGEYRQLDIISDLETIDVYRKIVDDIPDDNVLKRFKGDRYFEVGRLKNLFNLMKKDNVSVDDMHHRIDDYLNRLRDDESFYYKRNGKGYQKGDFKQKEFDKREAKMDLLREGVNLFPKLQEEMAAIDRYDYNDMIIWVLNEFEKNQDLLLSYQERYQYFLVDEYQDTNGSQNKLLSYLISYWDRPNVFVVGDDDQAIYKFQGANLDNIMGFKDQYDPLTIVLEENYRSNQKILDAASSLISNNTERLINHDNSLSKDLLASGIYKDHSVVPTINAFGKISEETAYIAAQLEKEYNETPESFNETAIIYRNHKQVKDLVAVLEKKDIPLNIKKKINILELPLIKNLVNLLAYLSEEFESYGKGQHRLFEILHYNYFDISSIDLGKIALSYKTKEDTPYVDWREIISDKSSLESLNLKTTTKILSASVLLEKWLKEIPEITLQFLFENILNEGGVLAFIMAQDNKSWLLQIIHTFFEFIKNETSKDPDLSLKELLAMIRKMNENKIELGIHKIISSESGVNMVTAHSSKGQEFKKVYLMGCTKKIWNSTSKQWGHFSYPDNVNVDNATNEQDERRLFYVAMTRAKTDLIISYSRFNEEGKDLHKSMFVDELTGIDGLEISNPEVKENILEDFYYRLLKSEDKQIELVEKDLIDRWLKSYKLSVTHLNKFLKCPLSFYFEAILRIPHARNPYTGFGTAMHDALRQFFENTDHDPNKQIGFLHSFFTSSLTKYKSHFTQDEFDSYLTHGKRALSSLWEEKKDIWFQAKDIKLEERIDHAEHNSIPLKGFLDKVEIYDNYVVVVDYKTGKPKNSVAKLRPPNDRDENGGDYWRQLVFYKILLDSDTEHNWKMQTGVIEYLEEDDNGFKTHEYLVTPDDIEVVGNQIEDTMRRINNYDFDKTCDQDDCVWCNFVKENYQIDSSLFNEEEPYEE